MIRFILGWFFLGGFGVVIPEKPQIPLTPEQQLQEVIADAHSYKNNQKLELPKIVEKLTTTSGSFTPQIIPQKFESKEKASQLISKLLQELKQESNGLPQKLVLAKQEENILPNSSRDAIESFKQYSEHQKNYATYCTALSGLTSVVTLAYWIKNPKNEIKGPLLSLLFGSSGVGLINCMARARHANHLTIAQRSEDIPFEQELLTKLNETLK